MSVDVDEVSEFARAGQILGGLRESDPTWLVVKDWAEAARWAYSQDAPPETIWLDLREQQSAKLNGRLYRDKADLKPEANRIKAEFSDTVYPRLMKTPLQTIVDDVLADLQSVAINRLLGGDVAPLLEEIFTAYRAGGWPCGWDGEYPLGRLVVFDGVPG
jgi:hypothetical protein